MQLQLKILLIKLFKYFFDSQSKLIDFQDLNL